MAILTTSPHLLICRPSPTTAEFTVTTLPPQTIATRILRLLLFLLRLLLALLAAVLLLARWADFSLSWPLITPLDRPPAHSSSSHSSHNNNNDPFLSSAYLSSLLRLFFTSQSGHFLKHISLSIPATILLPLSFTLFYVLSLRLHRTESILVLRGLGVQTSESSTTYLSGSATRFIPTEKIQDIFVNEAFRGFEVRYYLVVVVEGEENVVVVFPGLLPRKGVVEEVWRGVRGCLYEGKGKGEDVTT